MSEKVNLEAQKVLVLNAGWAPIRVCSIKQSIIDLCGGAFKVINFDNSTFLPCSWQEWLELPVNAEDECIHSAHQSVRVPKVIISINYKKIPKIKVGPPNTRNVAKHYKGICAYTGKKLSPKSNCLLAHRDINSLKSDMSVEEFERKHGYKPLVKPSAPKEKLVSESIENHYNIKEWEFFLKAKRGL